MQSRFLTVDQVRQDDEIVLLRNGEIVTSEDSYLWSRTRVVEQLEKQGPILLVTSAERRLLALELAEESALPAGSELAPLRSLLFRSEQALATAGKANQLLQWLKEHRYCGYCAQATVPDEPHLALRCPDCGHHFFPRINPCMIVLVTRGEEMLLARSTRYRNGFFSCLAGFIEAGESAEDTVVREVREEVGVEVENIRYFKSQSWPFPSQLMLGFYADYKSGDLVLEEEEIAEAGWFNADNLPMPNEGADGRPKIPASKISIAGGLIENFLQQMK